MSGNGAPRTAAPPAISTMLISAARRRRNASEARDAAHYAGGFALDPGARAAPGELSSSSAAPTAARSSILPRRLPRDMAAMTQAMGRISDGAGESESEGARWWMTVGESVPYTPALDARIPDGTVIPGILVRRRGRRQRAAASAAWRAGRPGAGRSSWRAGCIPAAAYDIPIKSGVLMWVAAFDHAEKRHTRHLTAVQTGGGMMAKLHRIASATRPFHARSGQLLLDAALMSGVDLPHDCRAGRCGSCLTRGAQGHHARRRGAPARLVHACQARVFSDLALEIEPLPPVAAHQRQDRAAGRAGRGHRRGHDRSSTASSRCCRASIAGSPSAGFPRARSARPRRWPRSTTTAHPAERQARPRWPRHAAARQADPAGPRGDDRGTVRPRLPAAGPRQPAGPGRQRHRLCAGVGGGRGGAAREPAAADRADRRCRARSRASTWRRRWNSPASSPTSPSVAAIEELTQRSRPGHGRPRPRSPAAACRPTISSMRPAHRRWSMRSASGARRPARSSTPTRSSRWRRPAPGWLDLARDWLQRGDVGRVKAGIAGRDPTSKTRWRMSGFALA